MTSNKNTAISFMRLITAGQVRDAYEKYVAPDFRHHNAWFPGDRASLLQGMEENAAQVPGKSLDVKRTLEDGDLVAVHSHMKRTADDPGVALVHIFRFEAG